MSKATKVDVARATEYLTDPDTYNVVPGSTLYTIVSHVSRSGMSRSIRVLVSTKAGQINDISHVVATVLGRRFDRNHGGVVMTGCGMDMTFALVYELSRTLYPDHVAEGQPHAGYSLKRVNL